MCPRMQTVFMHGTCSIRVHLHAYRTMPISMQVTYREALAAVFMEGWILFFLAITGTRQSIVRMLPRCVILATAAGVGLFLAFIGLQTANGIGLIAFDPATLVTLGGCPVDRRVHLYAIQVRWYVGGAC